MLILLKSSIKTSKLLALFILISTNLFAGRYLSEVKNKITGDLPASRNDVAATNNFSATSFYITDTIQPVRISENKPAGQEEKLSIPSQFANKQIDFQINSDITYCNFRDFRRNDSKKSFFQAWLLEKELTRIQVQTDSLRKAYASSEDDRKQELTGLILKNESETFTLNQEIPQLYELARKYENEYWKSASIDELNRFLERIKSYKDSLTRVSLSLQVHENNSFTAVPDTITMFRTETKRQETMNSQPGGIVYKIQIGAFRNKVPSTAEKLIKKLSIIRQIENYTDEKGVTYYTAGNLKTWKEAVILQKQVKQEGAKNPTVIGFLNGKKIDVNEAKKINHETNVP